MRTTMVPVIRLLLCVYVCYAEVANDYKDMIIEKHNKLRKQQNAAMMFELTWNDTLAREADAWISYCNFEYENKGRGENLAYNQNADIELNIQNWYDEIKTYNYSEKSCDQSCHYTQLVWSTTRQVGCALKKCKGLTVFSHTVRDAWLFGCWYDPKGNDDSQYPFVPGPACSGCFEGQTCVNDLCSGEPKKDCVDVSPVCAHFGTKMCQSNTAWMKQRCRKTCNFC